MRERRDPAHTATAAPQLRRAAARIRQWRDFTLPHAAPRPMELLRPNVLLRSHRLFRELRAADLTILTARRARTLYRLVRAVVRDEVPGAFVDCGVRNGGSTMLLSEGARGREIWAFDSFEGLPHPTAMDSDGPLVPEGSLRGSLELLEAGFQRYGNRSRLHVIKGWFEDTLASVVDEIGPISLLHVDADYYEPVKLALETFYPSVSPGGYVIVDDYFSFPGARRATDELRARHGLTQPLVWDHFWQR